jgi:endonuclease-3
MYPDVRCPLRHADAFQLLVATILSAQATDAKVNEITPAFFRRFPTPKALAEADVAEVEELTQPINFYRTKARHLVALARALVERFGGRVPEQMEDLTSLPGVGRKTANVVRLELFGATDGIVVDTHVRRVAQRLGLTTHDDPDRIEQDLLALVPPEERRAFSLRLIQHGRTLCTARIPRCNACDLRDLCPSARVFA